MIGDAPLSESTGIPGWETLAEERELIALARQYVPDNGGVVVELGVEYGRSTAQFSFATKEKLDTKIASVDLFPDNHHIAGQHGGLLAVWKRNLEESGVTSYPAYIIPIRGISWEVGDSWNEPIDLLFIDAGHTYEDVSRDISSWLHHVKPGGIVVFHDYAKDENAHPLHHEVKRAVDGYFNNAGIKKGYWKLLELPDSLIAYERNANFKESEEEKAVPKKPAAKAKAKTARKPKGKS